jgi:hypothetical protein
MVLARGFLYEDEEGKIQNRLEEAWVRVDDARAKALSVSTAFVKEVARLSALLFNALFGLKLFSFRAAAVSICLSTASVFFCALTVIVAGHQKQPFQQWLFAWCLGIAFLILGAYPAFKKLGERMWIWWCALLTVLEGAAYLLVVITKLLNQAFGLLAAMKFVALLVFWLAYSFTSDFLYIAVTRWMLSVISGAENIIKASGVLLLNALLGIFLFAYPVLLGVFLIWKLDFQAMAIGIAGTSMFN